MSQRAHQLTPCKEMEEQKRRKGPKSRQHPNEQYQSSHNTLEHGSNTHSSAQHFTHANMEHNETPTSLTIVLKAGTPGSDAET